MNEERMLTLNDNVHLVSSTGYEVRLSEAVIDVHKGNVVSEKPVWVKLTNGISTPSAWKSSTVAT